MCVLRRVRSDTSPWRAGHKSGCSTVKCPGRDCGPQSASREREPGVPEPPPSRKRPVPSTERTGRGRKCGRQRCRRRSGRAGQPGGAPLRAKAKPTENFVMCDFAPCCQVSVDMTSSFIVCQTPSNQRKRDAIVRWRERRGKTA